MDRSESGHEQINGYLLIQARSPNEVDELAYLVERVPGVVKAQRVHGPYDVIAELSEPGDGARTPPAASAISELDAVLRAIPLAIASVGSTDSAGEAA